MNYDIMTEQEINDICKKYNIENYTINPDGSIDVDGSVYISGYRLSKLPLKFNRIRYNFYCGNNLLTTFENFPIEVGFNFNCSYNLITSLKGCPKYVGGNFTMYNNLIDTIDNLPQTIKNDFDLRKNPLKSLGNYNLSYDLLKCDNKEKLISDHIKNKRKDKINKLNLL